MRHRTSEEWVAYFAENERLWSRLEWPAEAGVTCDEIGPILRSIQAWQLGETSDGRHLRAAAARHAYATGDPAFADAVEHFIREEQRHGEALGQFLDRIGAPRIRKNWGDSAFRAFRYARPSMELWTTVVIMVETMALVFYGALRRATPSPLMRQICGQILRDEVPHLRFQFERLAAVQAARPTWKRRLVSAAQRLLFFGVVLAVWVDHRRLLKAGGHSFATYWSQSWRRMWWIRREMYAEGPARRGGAVAAPPIRRTPENAVDGALESPSRTRGWLH